MNFGILVFPGVEEFEPVGRYEVPALQATLLSAT
jgi:hypothetical protein